MSKTIVDMPKVAQMLDSGWRIQLYVGGMRSYVAVGSHDNPEVLARLEKKNSEYPDYPNFFLDEDGEVITDDFTPEQALTRLAYKVHGEIIE